MSSYRTIQVTPKEYELLTELHKLLMKVGTKTVEDRLSGLNVDKILKDMERNTLAKGAVAGLAIALLLYILESGQVIPQGSANSKTVLLTQRGE